MTTTTMRIDWVTVLAILTMVASLVIGITYYYNTENQSCISDPLVYGAKQLEDRFEYEFAGRGMFVGLPRGIASPIITFNSSTVSFQNILR